MRFLDIDSFSQEIDYIDENICNDELVLDYVSNLIDNYMFYITLLESEGFRYIDCERDECTMEDNFESIWSFDFYQDIDRAD